MKKLYLIFMITIIIVIVFVACDNKPESDTPAVDQDKLADKIESNYQELTKGDELFSGSEEPAEGVLKQSEEELNQDEGEGHSTESNGNIETFYSPFTGLPAKEIVLDRAVMVSIENSPQARPQDGLQQASIVYEFLTEGGITRFLALYWGEIPDKIGPVRSVRPYLIETAQEYNALLLHAGASPAGFTMLDNEEIKHLDQIYNSRYYWRSNDRKAPHNLYTGIYKFSSYLKKITGQEYKMRFPFQQISFVNTYDQKANNIYINYWGNNKVCYQYQVEKNLYYRYISDLEHPHKDANGRKLSTRNLIVQFVNTDVVDSVGRLEMDLEGKGDALIFKDGIVKKVYWQKGKGELTNFYNQDGVKEKLNPGNTWIEVVPLSVKVEYEE